MRLPPAHSRVFGQNGATWLFDERSGMVGWCNDVAAAGGAHDKLAQRIGMYNQTTGKPLTYAQLASLDYMWGGAIDRSGNVKLNSALNNKEYGRQAAADYGDPVINAIMAQSDMEDRAALRAEVDPNWGGIQGREPPPGKQIGQKVLRAFLDGRDRQYNTGAPGGGGGRSVNPDYSTDIQCPKCRENILHWPSANAAYGRQLSGWNCDHCRKFYSGNAPFLGCRTVSRCDWGVCESCVCED